MGVKKLNKTRFNALCYSRQPFAEVISEEVEWFADDNEKVLGIVLHDLVDEDWLWIVLGRDANGLFRAIDLEVSISSRDDAKSRLHAKLSQHASDPTATFIQGDERKRTIRLFERVVATAKFHPLFNLVRQGDHHSAARGIMQEIANAFIDVDGNYLKDFQTTGFNARLWELFLFAFFHEQRFAIPRKFDRPDFCLDKGGFPIAVEAATVNPTAGEAPPSFSNEAELQALRQQYMPIKFGSALYSKLQRRYWELPHMRGKPFLLAVHDFHCDDSMTWSAPALEEYLYGARATWWKDETGKLHIVEKPIDKHVWGKKSIPSGFFNQPDAENVSAVLFSNSATISKFNRIGKLAGFGNPNVVMVRLGVRHDFDPNATEPIPFQIAVEAEKYDELWSEGVRIFHNPRAKLPIPQELFPHCAHHHFRNGRRVAMLPEGFIHQSKTLILTPKAD